MKEFKNEFSWSFSRDNLFKECNRKYYYNYYGSWNGWSKEKADNVTRTLYVLKNLVNRKIWKGDAVHKELSRILKTFKSTGKFNSLDDSLRRLTKIMRDEFRFSKGKSYWNHVGSLRKVNALYEHEYDMDIQDKDWKDNYEETIECLKNFYSSSILTEMRTIKKSDIISIDSTIPTPFDFNNSIIYVNLDLAYFLNDNLKIVDWKTGVTESNPLQFAVYALHVNNNHNIPLEKITVVEYNLQEKRSFTHSFTSEDIEKLKTYINNSIYEMKSLLADPDENEADITDFHRTEEVTRCDFCNYKKICFDLP